MNRKFIRSLDEELVDKEQSYPGWNLETLK